MKINSKSILMALATALALSITVSAVAASQKLKPRTEQALEVDKFFWSVFNGGQYEQIPAILEALMGVYLGNPDDFVTASHLGWVYAWRAAEQQRMATAPATLVNDFILGRKYFSRAALKNPRDGRYTSGEALMTITEGLIHQEPGTVRKGYQIMRKGIRKWPEFNLFTDSYLASRLPTSDPKFKTGLTNVWKNVDVCIGTKIDRTNPDMTPYMHKKTTDHPKSVCWNAEWMAPHNFEGFFLHMGDMVVKAGDWQVGQILYQNVKLVPEYATWPFKDVLEERILHAEDNVAAFNAAPDETGRTENPVMANSTFACMACHQN